MNRLIDCLPDVVGTTAQGLWHVVSGPVDLATIPPRRRRRFDPCRFNVKLARDTSKVLRAVNGFASIFTAVGPGQGRYVYHDNDRRLGRLLDDVANGGHALEMVDVHCLDHVQHWNMRDDARVARCYRAVDQFLAGLQVKCERNDITLVVLSDHGMEPVREVVDLRRHLRALGVPADEYEIFLENTKATFWFYHAGATLAVREYFSSCSFGTFLGREDMKACGLQFEDNRHGDAFLCADAGVTFFPNDFHGLVSSTFIALSDQQQRARLRMPWHQADHGYLPENDSEIGFMLVARRDVEALTDWVEMIDLAPSLLALIGSAAPPSMSGRIAFAERSGAPWPRHVRTGALSA